MYANSGQKRKNINEKEKKADSNLRAAKTKYVFFSWFMKERNLYFGVAIFWIGGKNYILKNENCIVFPEL